MPCYSQAVPDPRQSLLSRLVERVVELFRYSGDFCSSVELERGSLVSPLKDV